MEANLETTSKGNRCKHSLQSLQMQKALSKKLWLWHFILHREMWMQKNLLQQAQYVIKLYCYDFSPVCSIADVQSDNLG